MPCTASGLSRGMYKSPCHTEWIYRLILVSAGQTGLFVDFYNKTYATSKDSDQPAHPRAFHIGVLTYCFWGLTFTTLSSNSADDNLMTCFIFPENHANHTVSPKETSLFVFCFLFLFYYFFFIFFLLFIFIYFF